MKLYDAARCPFCARARIALAVKGIDYEPVPVDYLALRRGRPNEIAARVESLPLGESLFVDIAYLPWLLRLQVLYAIEVPGRLRAWWDELLARPAIAAELEIVRGLA